MAFSETLKLKVRKKSHLSCCLCKAIRVEVHHIIPQEENGPDTEENAAPLCPSCHEAYGANPTKRKFIREARDLWYEICEKRYASDLDRLDEIKKLLQNTVSYEDFQSFKEQLLSHMTQGLETPRGEEEIMASIDELFDKIWYNRHLILRSEVLSGKETVSTEIWQGALKAARKVEKRYGKDSPGCYSKVFVTHLDIDIMIC